MFEQHKTALLVCTCELIAPLNTALCYCPPWSRCWALVYVCVCGRLCEGVRVCEREEKNTLRTNALFIPPMSIRLVLITEIQSHMKAISIFVGCGWKFVCVCVCMFERASGHQRECMSFNAISRHLWQSLKGVKFVLGCVGGDVCVCVSNIEKQSVPTAWGISLFVCPQLAVHCVCLL